MPTSPQHGPFDYVIIGAGSAGCCLADRLSEDPRRRVCLLEAGPTDSSPLVRIPGLLVFLLKHARLNWNLRSKEHGHLHDRIVPIPRGRVLGGSSSINSMVYIRGRPTDYDAWAAWGCTGWGWADVLPVFRAMENNERLGGDSLHGSSGPLHVSDLASPNPLVEAFAAAGEALGIPRNSDFNGERQEGLGPYQVTMRKGRRFSAADAFLKPAMARPNLEVLTGCEVQRLVLDGHKAVAVEARQGTRNLRLDVSGEVILTAGAIGSPKLLMLSGIGDAASLAALGITPRIHLPAVGRNLQDHPATAIHMEGGDAGYGLAFSQLAQLAISPARYAVDRSGILASNMVEGGGFARTVGDLDEPDVQFHFIPGRVGHRGRMIEWGRGFYSDVCVLKPHSRGSLRLAGAHPSTAPIIDLNLLSDIRDQETLLRGLKLLRRLMSAPPLRQTGAREAAPGLAANSDDALADYIARTLGTAYHPVGTCRMGPADNPASVVDPELRLVGSENIRVADASIMPEIIAGNTNAPTMMIAERAARMMIDR